MLNVFRLHQVELTDVEMHQFDTQMDGLSVIYYGIDGCEKDLEMKYSFLLKGCNVFNMIW